MSSCEPAFARCRWRWYSARGASAVAKASAENVWNLTASAPATAAASTNSSAISGEPLWLTPASAMTRGGAPSPMLRPAISTVTTPLPERREKLGTEPAG